MYREKRDMRLMDDIQTDLDRRRPAVLSPMPPPPAMRPSMSHKPFSPSGNISRQIQEMNMLHGEPPSHGLPEKQSHGLPPGLFADDDTMWLDSPGEQHRAPVETQILSPLPLEDRKTSNALHDSEMKRDMWSRVKGTLKRVGIAPIKSLNIKVPNLILSPESKSANSDRGGWKLISSHQNRMVIEHVTHNETKPPTSPAAHSRSRSDVSPTHGVNDISIQSVPDLRRGFSKSNRVSIVSSHDVHFMPGTEIVSPRYERDCETFYSSEYTSEKAVSEILDWDAMYSPRSDGFGPVLDLHNVGESAELEFDIIQTYSTKSHQ